MPIDISFFRYEICIFCDLMEFRRFARRKHSQSDAGMNLAFFKFDIIIGWIIFIANTLLRAQKKQEGDTDTVTVYLFLAKIPCRFSKLPNRGIPWILRQFSVHWTKISFWGHNKTKRGIPILSRYTSFWQKYDVAFQKNKRMPWIFRQFTVHWTKKSFWGHNKTKREIPIFRLLSRYTSFWQKIRCRFSFWLGFGGRACFLVVAKNPEKHILYIH